MSVNETKEQALVKLGKLLQPGRCLVPSCHKVQCYVDYLSDPRAAKQAYEDRFSHRGGGSIFDNGDEVSYVEVTAVRDVVLAAERQLQLILEDIP